MSKTQKCPHCGNYIEGKRIQSYTKKVVKTGVKSAVNAATSVGAAGTGAAIGSAIFPGIGTIVGAGVGLVGSAMFHTAVNDGIDAVADVVTDAEYEFTCPKCGHKWTGQIEDVDDDDDLIDEEEGFIPLTSYTEQRIKQIIADLIDCDADKVVSTKVLYGDYSEEYLRLIIHTLEVEFDIKISKSVSEILNVDDLIESVTACRIDGYDYYAIDKELETYHRYEQCYISYNKGMYRNIEMSELANIFEKEASACNSEFNLLFYGLAALVRMDFFLEEWLDNGFENYSEYDELFEKCIFAGLDDIQKVKEMYSDEEQIFIISEIYNMLNDFFINTISDKTHYIETYAHKIDKCNNSDNNRLIEQYNQVYDRVLAIINFIEAKQENTDVENNSKIPEGCSLKGYSSAGEACYGHDEYDGKPFRMTIDDVFLLNLNGGKCVLTGYVEEGSVHTNDVIYINGKNDVRTTIVLGIEMSSQIWPYAEKGDNVGILISDDLKDILQKGMVVSSEELVSSCSTEYSDNEREYLNSVKELLEDNTAISDRERKMLNRIRQSLGISEERAAELEASLTPQLTEDEQEYVEMYREYAEKGEITEKERRRLDKFAAALGISEERMKEIEL